MTRYVFDPLSLAAGLLCAASTVTSCFAAAPASRNTWSAPVALNGGLNAYGPGGIALDDAGNSATAWLADPGNFTYPVEGNTKTAQGAWSAPVTLPSGNTSYTQQPMVHITANGLATAVWVDSSAIWTSDSNPGGPWSKPVKLTSAPANYGGAVFRMNRRGDCLVVWQTSTPRNQLQLDTLSRRSGQSWSAVKTLPASQTFNLSDVYVGASGVAAVSGYTGSNAYTLHTLVAPTVDGSWRSLGPLPTTPVAQSFVAVDALGRIELAAYARDTSVIAYKNTGSSWSGPAKVAPSGDALDGLGTDDAGDATILLLEASRQKVSVAQGSIATNKWQSIIALFTNPNPSLPGMFFSGFLDIASNGKAVVSAFFGKHAEYFKIQVSERPAATALWSPAVVLPGQTDPECVEYGQAINPAGQAVILWNTYRYTRNEYASSYP